MTHYVLTFRAQPHRTPTAEQEASWPAWFSQIGPSIADMGNRVGQARSVGSLAARAATADIVDVCVVEGAIRRRDVVVSSDPDDLRAIAAAVNRRLEIDRP